MPPSPRAHEPTTLAGRPPQRSNGRGPRTLRSRVLTLAGVGVFVAAAVLSMLSRQTLLELERSVRAEQDRVAAAGAAALGRDLILDLETLQGTIGAPPIQGGDTTIWSRRLSAAARELRLADGVCYADAGGTPVVCEPDTVRARLRDVQFPRLIRQAIVTERPLVSPATVSGLAVTAIAVVPAGAAGGGAAVAVIAPDGRRVTERLPIGAHLLDDATPGVPVPGSPWMVRAADSGASHAAIATFRLRSLWLAPTLTGLALVMAWGIVVSVQRPLLTLSRAAERIAAGHLSDPIPRGGDEIGRLGAALDDMRVRLKASIEASDRANAELERRVEERTAQLQRLLGKVISAQEDERRRVARELHDETGQVVTALGLALHAGVAMTEPDRVKQLRALVDRLHEGLHRIIVNLRPTVLDDLGLAAAIEGLADSQLRRAGLSVRCELGDLQDWRTDPAVEIAVFRIVQEAILNTVRHAAATTVLLQGGVTDGRLWIEMEDDGRGFEPGAVTMDEDTLRGIGLAGMRERTELLGGRLQIDSAPGRGTRVRIEAPVTPS